jgi:seryl-tRNA synthetase
MHDARALLDMGAEAVRRLARRGYSLDLSALESLQAQRNQNIRSADELRAESKRVAGEVQQAAKQGEDISKLKERAREIEADQEQVQEALRALLPTLGLARLVSA